MKVKWDEKHTVLFYDRLRLNPERLSLGTKMVDTSEPVYLMREDGVKGRDFIPITIKDRESEQYNLFNCVSPGPCFVPQKSPVIYYNHYNNNNTNKSNRLTSGTDSTILNLRRPINEDGWEKTVGKTEIHRN